MRIKKVNQVCSFCLEKESCIRNTETINKCYLHWYNTTQRNKESERIRQAKYRSNNFPKYILTRFKSKAKKEGRNFNLDENWIKTQLKNKVCSVTGLPFEIPTYKPGKVGERGPWTPSVDRIDNNLGYTKNNCQLVIWMYNLAKNNYTENDLIRMSMAFVSKKIMMQPVV